MRGWRAWPVALLAACGATLGAGKAFPDGCAKLPPGTGVLPTAITPVALRPLQAEVIAVPATDDLIHLVYAAQLTNMSPAPARIDQIVPVDPLDGFQPSGHNLVLGLSGRTITGLVRPFRQPMADGERPAEPADQQILDGGGSGIAFFDITYGHAGSVPRLISHRVSVTYRDQTTIETTDPLPVACTKPVVLSPPLVGPRWWNGDGCCAIVGPHRGATLGVNGAIVSPEQFAIDFVQLTPAGGCCTGPVKQLESWPFFGAPVLAAADGVVVDKLDGLPEQVPGPPVGVTAQNAAGNSIIEDIGNGRYILYAHLMTHSIPRRIGVGTRLVAGQQIGAIGNTGSTTAPHLHFQVMDRPSALNATGLPFVFDRQLLQGRVVGTLTATNKVYESGGTVDYREEASPSTRLGQMPAETQVFGYHLQ